MDVDSTSISNESIAATGMSRRTALGLCGAAFFTATTITLRNPVGIAAAQEADRPGGGTAASRSVPPTFGRFVQVGNEIIWLERVEQRLLRVSRLAGDTFVPVGDWHLPEGFDPVSVAGRAPGTVHLCGYRTSVVEIGPFENSGRPMAEALAGLTLPDVPRGSYMASREVISSVIVTFDLVRGVGETRSGLGEFELSAVHALVGAVGGEMQLVLHGSIAGIADSLSVLSAAGTTATSRLEHRWDYRDTAVSAESYAVRFSTDDRDVLMYGTGGQLRSRMVSPDVGAVLTLARGVPTAIGFDSAGSGLRLTNLIDDSVVTVPVSPALTSVTAVDGGDSTVVGARPVDGQTKYEAIQL
jgi:hypothetical protein